MPAASVRRRYLREYPRLLHTLTSIVEHVKENDLPISLLALFGSVARLTSHQDSDADVLVLFAGGMDYASELERTTDLLHIIRRAEDETVDEHYRWPIMPIPGDECAADLDPDFVATVGREGVLLYQRPGASIPDALVQLHPFDDWKRRVGERLARRYSVAVERTP